MHRFTYSLLPSHGRFIIAPLKMLTVFIDCSTSYDPVSHELHATTNEVRSNGPWQLSGACNVQQKQKLNGRRVKVSPVGQVVQLLLAAASGDARANG